MTTNAALPLNVYGYAEVQTDGTTLQKSPNVSVSRSALGVYIITPSDLFPNSLFVMTTVLNGVPFIASAESLGDGTVRVRTYSAVGATSVADAHFGIILYNIGLNSLVNTP